MSREERNAITRSGIAITRCTTATAAEPRADTIFTVIIRSRARRAIFDARPRVYRNDVLFKSRSVLDFCAPRALFTGNRPRARRRA